MIRLISKHIFLIWIRNCVYRVFIIFFFFWENKYINFARDFFGTLYQRLIKYSWSNRACDSLGNLHNHFWKLHKSTRGTKIYTTNPVNQRRNNVRELSLARREQKKRKRLPETRVMLKSSSNSRQCKQLRTIKICQIKFRVCNSWCAFGEKLVLTYYRFTTQSRTGKQGEGLCPVCVVLLETIEVQLPAYPIMKASVLRFCGRSIFYAVIK